MKIEGASRPQSFTGLLIAAMVGGSVLAGGCSVDEVPRRDGGFRVSPSVPAGGVLIQGGGATFPSVLYEKWFAVYGAAHPLNVVTYDAVGSGEGIRRFIANNINDEDRLDFGASDAAMRDDELAAVAGGAFFIPLTAGSVALAYNLPELPAELRLSRQAYAGIFLGTITNWADRKIAATNPGVKLPNLTIATVVRQDGSGTTFAFTKHLDAISDPWRAQFGAATTVDWPGNSMRASGNEGVAARIKQSIGSVGYVSYEFAHKAGLQVARLENLAGEFVTPSEKSSSAALAGTELPDNLRLYVPDPAGADSYPIVTLTWVLLYKNYRSPQKAQAIYDLFHWCLTDGQRYAPELGYAPLPANIVSRSLAALESLRPPGTGPSRTGIDPGGPLPIGSARNVG